MLIVTEFPQRTRGILPIRIALHLWVTNTAHLFQR